MGKLILAIFLFSSIGVEAQQLVINELMTSNSTALIDEDGDTPDWIELYNKSVLPVNLFGYSLSDDKANLQKWIFPDITLQPQTHFLVFASGKNRLTSVIEWETVIDWGDNCRYLPVVSQPDIHWNTLGFDDTSWPTGATGVGYGDDDDNTVIDPVITVYSRQIFDVKDVAQIEKLILHIDFDDSFVAYLNGNEIARSNIGTIGVPPAFDEQANEYLEAKIYAGGEPERFEVLDLSLVENGENVLAIEVHNFGTNSSDLTLIPFLSVGYNSQQDSSRGINSLLTFPEFKFHTNFKLSSAEESLYLTSPALSIQDSVAPLLIPIDYSFGRKPDGTSEWVFFSESTPGQENITSGITGFSSPVTMSPSAGFYESSVTINLAMEGSPSKIYYTLDGSEPDSFSTLYENPVIITSTTVIRALGYQQTLLPGKVSTQTYFINETTDLPVLSLVSDPFNLWDSETGIYADGANASPSFPHFGANFWEDWERPAHIQFFESDKNTGFESGCGIKIFGGWSRGFPQKSFSVFFRSEYGNKSLRYPLFQNFNVDNFESLVLRNSGNDWDASMMRDGMMQTLINDLDVDHQQYRPVLVFINGQYWGIYNIREKINEHYIASHHSIDPANIDMLENERSVIHGDNQHYDELLDYIKTNNMATLAAYNFVQNRVDLDEYIDYMVSQIYFDNRDWPGNNIKFWRPKTADGKWRWILYDTDFGFNRFDPQAYKNNTLTFALEENGPGWPNPPWSTLLFRKFLENESIKNQFINRTADLLNSTFRGDKVKSIIDSVDSTISGEMINHLNRWNLDHANRSNHLNFMNTFADFREVYLRSFLLQHFGLEGTALVELSSSEGGRIKINRLGVDQFPWQGYYFKGVPLQMQAVAEKGYTFTGWSGHIISDDIIITINPNENFELTANFTTDQTNHGIVINEINYNSANNFESGDWIELYNNSGIVYDLSGWVFKDSDDSHGYEFDDLTMMEPRSFLVLVENDSAFSIKYPAVSFVGPMNFGLSSKGEQVRLYNDQGIIADSLTYNDKSPWPEEADGTGATLELINPTSDNSMAESWRASVGNGSPGEHNTVYTALDDPEIANHYFSLEQNYPNPFNPKTEISYQVKGDGFKPIHINLAVYNVLGQKVKTLVNGFQQAGRYNVNFDATDMGAGLYFYKLQSESFEQTKKMLFLP